MIEKGIPKPKTEENIYEEFKKADLEKWCLSKTEERKADDKTVFMCTFCRKKFKSTIFSVKHIMRKHEENINEVYS